MLLSAGCLIRTVYLFIRRSVARLCLPRPTSLYLSSRIFRRLARLILDAIYLRRHLCLLCPVLQPKSFQFLFQLPQVDTTIYFTSSKQMNGVYKVCKQLPEKKNLVIDKYIFFNEHDKSLINKNVH